MNVAVKDMAHAAEQTLPTHVFVIQLCATTSPENFFCIALGVSLPLRVSELTYFSSFRPC